MNLPAINYQRKIKLFLSGLMFFCMVQPANSQNTRQVFRVIAFYSAKQDQAYISFVHEANRWFTRMGREYGFIYDATHNWDNLNTSFLSSYQVTIFLDTRPETESQRCQQGHNDIDYELHSTKELSLTFNHPLQDKLILNALD